MIDPADGLFGRGYVLERELGRGGMATVYLASDSRHARKVAVKVLHAELAALVGAERFLEEIRVTAQLQHPHVLGLIDSGVFGDDAGELRGRPFYVMPYVAGESLRARLEQEGPLPVADALRIVREVGAALEHAHRRGIVHRDIKPENVLLGEDGDALVADFGIALAVRTAGGTRLTESGLSLGTPQYMSPEQAMGERQITARTDIYALGAMLYEMLAGEPPFTGASAQAIVARVLTEAPRSLVTQRPTVPSGVDAAVRRALEKLPADRFASAREFVDALSQPETGAAAAPSRSIPLSQVAWRRRYGRIAALIGGALAVAVAVAWTVRRGSATAMAPSGRSTNHGPIRFVIDPDSGEIAAELTPAISPDGRTIVYVVRGSNGNSLYARRLDDIASRSLPETDGAEQPFFSPDGAWVAFFSRGAIRKLRLDGGSPVLVTDVRDAAFFGGGWWSLDDTIRYAVIPGGALFRVSANGGPAARITVVDSTQRIGYPQLLPGGRAILVTTVHYDLGTARMGVLDVASGRLRDLGPGAGARYVGGHIIYAGAGGQLYRQSFDLDRASPRGSVEEIASGLDMVDAADLTFAVSESGALVYRVSRGNLTLIVADRAGKTLQVIPSHSPWSPRFAPDGRHLAFGARAPARQNSDVWIADPSSGTTQRLTSGDNTSNDPEWSPDGKRIAFHTGAPGGSDLFVQRLDDSRAQPITRRAGTQWTSDWLRDGSALLFTEVTSEGEMSIWVQPMDGRQARPYLQTSARESGARASPDGRWVAYTSDETGRKEVYVQSYPTAGLKTLVSTDGGVNPVWRNDGRELYYWHSNELVAASLSAASPGESLDVRGRTTLFRTSYEPNVHANYDVSPDGSRFAIVSRGEHASRLVVALDALGADSSSRVSPP